MKKVDVFLLVIFIAVTIGATALQIQQRFSAEASQVVVYADGKIVKNIKFPLKDQEFVIETELGRNEVQIKDGKVYMKDADCKDKLCVYSKPIEYNGEMIVCLPHKVYVEVQSQKDSQLDAVSM